MATRFYIDDNAAAVSPSYDAGWEDTAQATTRRALVTLGAFSDHPASPVIATASGVANRDYLWVQAVSMPLAAQTITGTFKGILRVREDGTLADARTQVIVRVVSNDGSTVRGTLLAMDTAALGSDEFGTTFSTRYAPRGGAQAVTSVAAQNGDRIVLEVGYRAHGTGTPDVRWAANAAPYSGGDFAFTEGINTTDTREWFEFSQTLIFSPGTLAGTITPTGTLVKKIKKLFTGSITPSGIATAARKVILAVAGAITPSGSTTVALNNPPVTIGGVDHTDYIDFTSAVLEKSAAQRNSLFRFRHVDEALNTGGTLVSIRERDEVIVSDASGRLFGGQIATITPTLDGLTIVRNITCQSFNCLLDQVVIESDTQTGARYDDDDVVYLVTTYGAAVGLSASTSGFVERTRTTALGDIDYSGMTLRHALNELAQRCTVAYWVDDYKRIHWTDPASAEMVSSGDFTATTGWTLDAAATKTADAGPGGTGDYALVTVGSGAGRKESTQTLTTGIVEGQRYLVAADLYGADATVRLEWQDGASATVGAIEVLSGTGAEWATATAILTCPATATKLVVRVGGVNNFNTTVKHDNVSVVGETAPFGVSTTPDGTTTRSMESWQRPTEAPLPVNRLLVIGDGISGWREHAASIAYYGQRFEGKLEDKRVTTTTGIDTRADWFFGKHAFPSYSGHFVTRDSGIEPGDYVIVEVEPLGLQAIEYVTEVIIRWRGNDEMIYTVTYGQPTDDLGAILGDISERELGIGEVEGANIKALAITSEKLAVGAVDQSALDPDVIVKFVTNNGTTVVVDDTGLTVTGGAITVENSGATVIIDGESDMFKIAASGSQSGTVGTTATTLTGLGTLSATPVALLFHTWNNNAVTDNKYVGMSYVNAYNGLHGAIVSGGSPTTKFLAIQSINKGYIGLNGSNQAVVSSNVAEISGLANTVYQYYYVLQETAF